MTPPSTAPTPVRTRRAPRWVPALVLVLLAPVVAEVSIGTAFSPVGLIVFAALVPIYGGGALLARELVRHRGRGWAAVVLLGVAYGIVEEGLALQSFFSPTIYDAIGPGWGGRFLEINGSYTLVQLINHAVFSVLVPVVLVELLFPGRGREPYLRVPGLVVTTAFFAFGVVLMGFSARFTLDIGYATPAPWPAVSTGLVVVLVIAAAVLPARWPTPAAAVPVPAPAALAAGTAVATVVAIGVVALPGYLRMPFMRTGWVVVPVVVCLVVTALTAVLLTRWSRSAAFDDRHLLAAAAGALVGHTVVFGIIHPTTDEARWGVAIGLVVTLVLLGLLWRTTARRVVTGPPREWK